ncbi:MAG: NAD(P)-dependent oxidoreductase [Actinobacteria bacterium]|jgi:SDR family mycofactocin-dependent oxidoreductase|nr:NAD(P)-dependent oxidoreductase [Actinomycetota bacterium]
MGSMEGRVALITGAARGQGRAHAVKLSGLGMDIIGIDLCADIASMDYPNATEADLVETVKLVEANGRKMMPFKADVRDFNQLDTVISEGCNRFRRLDVIIANAGIINLQGTDQSVAAWNDVINVNLNGVYFTLRSSVPHMINAGNGGSIVLTSSSAGLKSVTGSHPSALAYASAKWGLRGLMQAYAHELAPHGIRVNTIHPTGVLTGMTQNEAMAKMAADPNNDLSAMQNLLPIQILQAEDIANAVAFLVSDEAHYITGVSMPLDAGFSIR